MGGAARVRAPALGAAEAAAWGAAGAPVYGRASPALPATHAAPARALPQLALVAGVAVADALEHLTDLSVQIKWPNDVMLRRQKVCGILAEARDGAVVLGIGVNLTQGPAELPERAGSLLTTTGQEFARDDVLAAVLDALGARYEAWLAGGLDAVYEGLGPRDFLRGRTVSVNGTTGVAQLIDREGRLLIAAATAIRSPSRAARSSTSADVSWRVRPRRGLTLKAHFASVSGISTTFVFDPSAAERS